MEVDVQRDSFLFYKVNTIIVKIIVKIIKLTRYMAYDHHSEVVDDYGKIIHEIY